MVRLSASTLHPFPARMAPDIALQSVKHLHRDSVVLDPMAGSGTVLWHAAALGHRAVGFDLDPLAVLISRVRTAPIRVELIGETAISVVSEARALRTMDTRLPWIDDDLETSEFVEYWFGRPQATQLRLLAYVLWKRGKTRSARAELDALRLVLSRLIIRKQSGASLAWDISHSRPHRVQRENTFDVLQEFLRSSAKLEQEMTAATPLAKVEIYRGDARRLTRVRDQSIDAVITSPPYLNAIDYLRGHKLSLVWLGHSISQLRSIRSISIGSERSHSDATINRKIAPSIISAFGDIDRLPRRQQKMVFRYAADIEAVIKEIVRVLKPGGRAVLVVGNSCLKEVFIRNSSAVANAARLAGLSLLEEQVRELPDSSRYLPINVLRSNSLGKRMRTETVMTFLKPTRLHLSTRR